jgi:predicted MFS family arabinose efflux permease
MDAGAPDRRETQTKPAQRAPAALVTLLAFSAGGTVANLYYNQPLLAAMARSTGATERQIGMIPTLTQLGYGLAMVALVPLGDRYERRGLIVRMTWASVVALGLVAIAPNWAALCVASLLLGIASMIPQYIIPYAAGVAAPEERGRVVGTVMSGLLIGILVSRTVSGFVGEHFGWRTMYVVAAFAMAALSCVLRVLLPPQPPEQEVSLRALYVSLVGLVREQPVLRLHAALGALTFAGFSAFWSTLAFHLESPQLGYGSAVAGSFGLIGVGGALAAPLAGRFSDGRDSGIVTILAGCAVLVSFAIFGVFGTSLLGLAAGVILLDLGVQASQITNQARVYGLAPHMRNRLNTVYMATYFAGGALGSALGGQAWSIAGWTGVSITGGVLAAAALAVFVIGRARLHDRAKITHA